MRYRVLAEIRWLQTLAHNAEIPEVPALSASAQEKLERIAASFTLDEAQRVKAIEDTTNHDVKAVEYYLKEKISSHPDLSGIKDFVHFARSEERRVGNGGVSTCRSRWAPYT